LFADDDLGINRQRAASATCDGAEAKTKVTLRCDARDAIEPAIDQYFEDEFASQIDGQVI
jgi:hypothetical protein